MTARWCVVGLVLCVAGCVSSDMRSTQPLDKPVYPLRAGAAGGSADEMGGTTSATSKSGAQNDFETAPPRRPGGTRSYVVLLPDDDGTVGKLEVSSNGDTVLLDSQYAAVDLNDLSRTFEASAADLDVFERSLSAEPPPAVRFNVYFDLDEAEPSASEVARVSKMLAPVSSWAAPEVSIAGHADRRGTDLHNQALSAERAAAVARLLAGAGVKTVIPPRISAFGETRPAVSTADGVEEPRNRRVVVKIR